VIKIKKFEISIDKKADEKMLNDTKNIESPFFMLKTDGYKSCSSTWCTSKSQVWDYTLKIHLENTENKLLIKDYDIYKFNKYSIIITNEISNLIDKFSKIYISTEKGYGNIRYKILLKL